MNITTETLITSVVNIGTSKVISLVDGQIQFGNDSYGSVFPSDRGLPKQFLVTDGAGIMSWADRGRILKSQFINPAPGGVTQSQTDVNECIITLEINETTITAGSVTYFGSVPTMSIRYDIKDLTNSTSSFGGVIVATTGDFIPSSGFNTVAFSSFPAIGSGGSLVLLVIILL